MARLNQNRSTLLLGCGSAALAVGLAMAPQQASAQAFQATETFVEGSGSRVLGSGTETITIDTNTAVIDWTPDEDGQGNAINFLPTGNIATFRNGAEVSDFAVLNRILPSTNGDVVVFGGTVLSRIFDATGASTPGGTLVFYSPTGILVGNNAVFDVGNLILTTLEPTNFTDWAGSGQTGGLDLFGPTGSTASIIINPGAQVLASAENSYFAVTAAEIQMYGTALVNGSHAYVAGQQVNLTISNGLFDIFVPVGTSVATPIIIDGNVGGPASNGSGDNHMIYAVAAAQADPISMIFRGNLGFAPAASAGIVNGEIILSANFDVSGRTVAGVTPDDGINGAFDGRSETTDVAGSIFMNDFVATSSILAAANEEVQITAFNGPSSIAGNLQMFGRNFSELTASNGQIFNITGDVLVSAEDRGRVGSDLTMADINAQGGQAFIDAFGGGSMTISGNARVTASAFAGFSFDSSNTGSATGGTASIASNGGTLNIDGSAEALADALAQLSGIGNAETTFTGGNAQVFTALGGDIVIDGPTRISAVAFGADGGTSGTSTGADAFGGLAIVSVTGDGSITFNSDVDIDGDATAGSSSNSGNGALADAGIANVFLDANGTVTFAGNLAMSARANGGFNFGGRGGDALGGASRIFVPNGGTVTIGGDYSSDANAFAGSGTSGGDAFAGISGAQVLAGLIDIEGNAISVAEAVGGNADFGFGGNGGNGTGGNAFLQSNGTTAAPGTLNVGLDATIDASGRGGNGGLGDGDTTAAGIGGTGTGGQLGVPNQADPNFGSGAFLLAGGENGNLTVLGRSEVFNFGIGGIGGNGGIDQAGGDGGLGQGGLAQVGSAVLGSTATVGAGTVNLGDVTIIANGDGGAGGFGGSTQDLRGNGGTGEGFGAFLTARLGTVTAGIVEISADGTGGEGHVGGDGFGGFTSVQAGLNATMTVQLLRGFAVGRGGFGDNGGGNATGGQVNLLIDGADVFVLDRILFESGALSGAVSSGLSGDATGGVSNISLATDGSSLQVNVGVELRSVAEARTSNGVGQGGSATGGDATINLTSNSSILINGNLGLDASAFGSTNFGQGSGGDAFGGRRAFAFVDNGGTMTVDGTFAAVADGRGGDGLGGGNGFGGVAGAQTESGSINFQDSVLVLARGFGGSSSPDGITFGGDGGNGQGGLAVIRADGTLDGAGVITITGDAEVVADGFGGQGGGGLGPSTPAGRGGDGIGGNSTTPIPTDPNPDQFGGAVLSAGGDFGTLLVGGNANVFANGEGGIGGFGDLGQAGGDGGNGTGGSAFAGTGLFGPDTDGSVGDGTAAFNTLVIAASGTGGEGGFGGSNSDPRGNGGDGSGNRALAGASAGGSLTANSVQLFANGIGGEGLTGGTGTGGSRAGISMNTNGSFFIGSFLAHAMGFGGIGDGGVGGNGIGGQAFIGFQDGTGVINGDASIEASGFGGSSNAADGGDGFGGIADIAIFTAVAGQGTITGHSNVLASGIGGGAGEDATGGNGFGGEAFILAQTGGTITLGSAQVAAIGAGGTGAVFEDDGIITSFTAAGGDGTGGFAQISAVESGSLVRILRNTPNSAVFAPFGAALLSATGFGGNANGGSGIGGDGIGGEANVKASGGAAIELPLTPQTDPNTVGAIRILSRGQGGNSSVEGGVGGTGTGGLGVIEADGGTISMGATIFSIFSQGGSSLDDALNITGGEAFGGDRQVSVINGGVLTAELLGGISGAVGGNGSGTGNGGNATGGSNSVEVSGATYNMVGLNISVDQVTGGDGNIGGNATGGISTVNLTSATINITPNADGVSVFRVGGTNFGGTGVAAGGSATGSDVVVTILETDVIGGSIELFADAIGGNADSDSGTGGAATAGALSFLAQDSNLFLSGENLISADATGGTAAIAGNGLGGSALVTLEGTTITLDPSSPTPSSLTISAAGTGGIGEASVGGNGNGGLASLRFQSALSTIDGAITIDATGRGGDSFVTNGGNGAGGEASIISGLISQSAGIITGHANVLANGIGGNAGQSAVGGRGGGGLAIVESQTGSTITLGSAQIGANGRGGTGATIDIDGTTITFTAAGGDGFGGFASISAVDTGSEVNVLRSTPNNVRVDDFQITTMSATGFGGNATGGSGIGGDGTGGQVNVIATNGGTIALPLTPGSDPNNIGFNRIHARGQGGNSSVEGGVGGTGFGGLGIINATGGTISMGPTVFSMFAQGGSSTNVALNITGGDAFGGDRQVIVQDGGELTAELLGGVSGALGGDGSGTGNGGNATGGANSVTVSGATFNMVGNTISVDQSTGGNGNVGGNASGGTSTVEIIGGTVNMLPNADGVAQFVVGGLNTGGTGILTGGSATGGTVSVTISEADVTGGAILVSAGATGGNADNVTGTGGAASAGTATFFSEFSNLVFTGASEVTAGAIGGNGATGGDATGGVVDFEINSSDVTMTGGQITFGGGVNGGTGAAGNGGDAVAGNVQVLLADVDWTGGSIFLVGQAQGGDGLGTSALGGSATGDLLSFIVTNNSVLDAGLLTMDGTVTGGAAPTGTGGNAVAGDAEFEGTDSTVNLIGNIDILADANGGAGATGGNATSGFASVNNSGVSMTISDDPNGGTSLNVSSVSTGGAGSVATGNAASGTAQLLMLNSSLNAGNLNLVADANAQATSAGPNGGTANGGTVEAIIEGTSNLTLANVSAEADATSSVGGSTSAGLVGLVVNTTGTGSGINIAGQLALSANALGGNTNTTGAFSARVNGGEIRAQSLEGVALGTELGEDSSSLVAIGGSIFVTGGMDIDVTDDFLIQTGSGGVIGDPVPSDPSLDISITSQGTVSILGDNDNQISFGGDSLDIASRDIVIANGARVGANSMQFTSLNTSGPAILGGSGTPQGGVSGEGYSFIAEELGRLEVGNFSFSQQALSSQDPNAPDLIIRDVTISGSLDDGTSSVDIRVDGSDGIIRVEGVVAYIDAASEDSLSLSSNGRIEIVTPGGIGIVGPNERPSGQLFLGSDTIWIADSDMIALLQADPQFAGRNDQLSIAAAGSDDPLGYLRAGAVAIEVGTSLLVRNTGSETDRGGILVGDGGLSIGGLSSGGFNGVKGDNAEGMIDVFAFGARMNSDGTLVTGEAFYREVDFNNSNASGSTTYTDLSEFNDCIINTGECDQAAVEEEPSDPAVVAVNNPTVVEAAIAAVQPVETTEQESDSEFGIDFPGLIESEDAEEETDIEDPVASGGDSSLYGQGKGGDVRVEGN